MKNKIIIGCVAVTKRGNKYLLGVRNKKASSSHAMYTIPGGTLEFGETIEECLHREMMEETNIRIKNLKFVKIYEYIKFKKRIPHRIVFIYTADYASGELKGEDDCLDPEFFSIKEITKMILDKKIPETSINNLKDLGII